MSKLRFGIVTEIDEAGPLVRVVFKDSGLLSPWLMVGQRWDENSMPDEGMQVACLLDECEEEGLVIDAVLSSEDPPPVVSRDKWRRRFKDGTILEYDRAAHKLTATIAAGGTAEIEATKLKVVGALEVTGPITAGGDIQASGNITTALGDVQAGGKSLKLHTHLGNLSSPTSPPL